jgi:hypothetical protein
MDEKRKRAYRYVLYWAMLDTRRLALARPLFPRLLNPFVWRKTDARIRRAAELADWLHNLSLFSALNFEDFNERTFWREYEHFEKHKPEYRFSEFKAVFDRVLAE